MDKYEELKLEIFESAESGEITESEKDSLLETLDSIYESTALQRKGEETYSKLKEVNKKIDDLKNDLKDDSISEDKKSEIKNKIKTLEKEKHDIYKVLYRIGYSTDNSLIKGKEVSENNAKALNTKTMKKLTKIINSNSSNATKLIKGIPTILAGSLLDKDYKDATTKVANAMVYGKKYKEEERKNSRPAKQKESGAYLKMQQALKESVMDLYLENALTESDITDMLEYIDNDMTTESCIEMITALLED